MFSALMTLLTDKPLILQGKFDSDRAVISSRQPAIMPATLTKITGYFTHEMGPKV